MRAVESHTPARPYKPHVKVKNPRGVGECSDGMTFHGYSMLVDLVVEGFAESDGVAGVIFGRGTVGLIWGEPKAETIKKVKTRGID